MPSTSIKRFIGWICKSNVTTALQIPVKTVSSQTLNSFEFCNCAINVFFRSMNRASVDRSKKIKCWYVVKDMRTNTGATTLKTPLITQIKMCERQKPFGFCNRLISTDVFC